MSPNLKAFLDTIAYSEVGLPLLARSDDGYNVLVGGKLFKGYQDHPRQLVVLKRGLGPDLRSTAAGRYQILARIFDFYKKELKLPDFGKASQDKIAIQLIKECDALGDIEAGRFETALHKCRSRWASLPGAGYNQPERNAASLKLAYLNFGGKLA